LLTGEHREFYRARHALAATRHLLEMYRRQLSDDKIRRRLQRLDRRLLDVNQQLAVQLAVSWWLGSQFQLTPQLPDAYR